MKNWCGDEKDRMSCNKSIGYWGIGSIDQCIYSLRYFREEPLVSDKEVFWVTGDGLYFLM